MTKLHVECLGTGPTDLVVCCGLTQTTANWKGLARQNPGYRWILFDPRGQGRSQIGRTPYQLDDHVDDLLTVISKCHCQRPNLIGFSHGGRVAMRAAARYPQLFENLILVSTAARNSIQRKAVIQSWAACLELGGVKALAWASLPVIVGLKILRKFNDLEFLVSGTASRNTREGLEAMFEGMKSYPEVAADAPHISVPTLIMRGADDPMCTQADDGCFKQWIPHCELRILEETGHTLPLEEPDLFIEFIARFLASQKRRSAQRIG